MSRNLLTAAAFVAFAFPAATTSAQMGYGLAAGLSVPIGDFGKATDTGYHLTGLVTMSAPLLPIGFRADGSFSEFNYSDPSSAKARLVYATVNAVVPSPGIFGPYVIGGFGIYHASAQCSTCTTTSTKGGINVGAGIKFGLGGLAVFVEARHHYIAGPSDPTNGGVKGSSTQFIPVSFGLTF
jgi:hypothetical protein